MDPRLVAMLCRTSDRSPEGARGAAALAELLGARVIGSPGEPREGTWQDDLRDARGCLLEAGGQIDDALEDGVVPILFASDCSICVTTLPVVVRHRPDVRVLWLDAHGDFNTPETTASQFLGGMCLSAACGLWDAGLAAGPTLDPGRVVMHGVRDVEGQEQVLLETNGVGRIEDPERLVDALAAHEVFVHLDLDVLDPAEQPATFPAAGGLTFDELHEVLDELVLSGCELVGAEITSASAPHAPAIAGAIAPLLEPRG